MRRAIFAAALLLIASVAAAEMIPSKYTITWQGNVGVPGGIPARETLCATADNATYGTNSTDATSYINGLISSCTVGQTVYLPQGTYKITGSGVSVNKGVTLRGAGADNTILQYGTSSSSSYIVTLGSTSANVGTGVNITSGYTKGSSSLVVASVSGLSVGDLIWIDQLNGAAYDSLEVTNAGVGGNCTWCGRSSGTRSMAQISRITSVSGTTIGIDPAMHYTYSASLDPEIAEISNVTDGAGLENLKISNYTGSGTGATGNIKMRGVKNSWVKNVDSYRKYYGGSTECYHNRMEYIYRSEIRDSYFHGNTQTGSNSYVQQMVYGSTGNLIENNIFDEAKAYVYVGWGASGNVIGYNYARSFHNTMGYYSGDISGHGAHPKFHLLEGNYGQKFRFDRYWGSGSHNFGFRNYFRATQPTDSPTYTITSYRYPVDVDQNNPYNSLVGNVLGSPTVSWSYDAYSSGDASCASDRYIYVIGFPSEGCSSTRDSQVWTTMFRHRNYDYSTNTTKSCGDSGEPGCLGGDGSTSLPNSLYLTDRPSWWCSEVPWPPIGSDLTPMVSDIPSKRRYEGLSCTLGGVADTTPDAFTLTDNTGVALSTSVTSAAVTVAGIDNGSSVPVVISGTGCGYRINGGSCVSSGSAALGDNVATCGMSSAAYETAYPSCTVSIGGVVDSGAPWTATTVAEDVPPAAPMPPRLRSITLRGNWR